MDKRWNIGVRPGSRSASQQPQGVPPPLAWAPQHRIPTRAAFRRLTARAQSPSRHVPANTAFECSVTTKVNNPYDPEDLALG